MEICIIDYGYNNQENNNNIKYNIVEYHNNGTPRGAFIEAIQKEQCFLLTINRICAVYDVINKEATTCYVTKVELKLHAHVLRIAGRNASST